MSRRPPPRSSEFRSSDPRRSGRSHDAAPKDTPGVRNPYVRYRPLNKPALEPQLTTLWEYPSQHYGKGQQGSANYRGATPSFVIWNVIERYSQKGDLVLDPFCGSGTTLDVCNDTERKGYGFDIAPARDDVQQADARDLPLPNDFADLAFFDPPYANNLTYSDHPDCIGQTRADDGSWSDAMNDVLVELDRVVKPGGVIAAYVSDILQKGKIFHPLGAHLLQLGAMHFDLVDHVAVVRHNAKLQQGNHRQSADEGGFLLRGFNHLLIFRKPLATFEQNSPPDVPAPERTSSRRSQREAFVEKSASRTSGPSHRPRQDGERSPSKTRGPRNQHNSPGRSSGNPHEAPSAGGARGHKKKRGGPVPPTQNQRSSKKSSRPGQAAPPSSGPRQGRKSGPKRSR